MGGIRRGLAEGMRREGLVMGEVRVAGVEIGVGD